MLHFFLACTCVHARSWNVCWPCSQDSLGESGSHLTVMICDGFPMVSRSIQQDRALAWYTIIYTEWYTIAYDCHLLPIALDYTCLYCHHLSSFPPCMMRILILCVCAGLVAGKTAKPFDTDLHWSDDVWRFPWLLFFFLDCVWLHFDMYKTLLDKASNWFLNATALPWVYPP